MKNSLISVIIPVYKVEKYLNKCINSVINQTYSNLEIILVDDGSPDNCGNICDNYAKKDKRIKVIHKQNGGLSSARNAGLEIATGSLISFIDSDDYVDIKMLEELKNNMEKYNSDISVCNFYKKYKFIKKIKTKVNKEYVFQNKEKYTEAKDGNRCINPCAWNKLYKKEIFNNIRYPEGKIFEDSYVIYDIADTVDKISYTPKALYFYRARKSSITKSKKKNNYDQVDALSKNIDFLTKKKYFDLADKEKYRKVHALLSIAYKSGIQDINDESYKEEKELVLKTARDIKDSKYLSVSQKNNIKMLIENINDYYKKRASKQKLNRRIRGLIYYK